MSRLIEDLSALSRRKALSTAELRRLDMYLRTSSDPRLLHEIGADYDRMRTDRPGDDALLRRVRDRTLARHARGAPPRRGLRLGRSAGWLLLGVLCTSVAGATAWRQRAALVNAVALSFAPAAGATAVPVSLGKPRQEAGGAARARSSSLAAAPVPRGQDATLESAQASAPGKVDATPRRSASAAASLVEDAPALFFRANADRKAGQVGRALASYQRLIAEYPTSPEARLSLVVSARLELRAGQAGKALGHFERYLESVPNGALSEEALQGKAQALRALGRLSEEQAAWRRLLERFPKSVQAETARERLLLEP